ncbi:MAG: hypothetical protein ACTSXO_12415 [Candidatus Heimdallarchaeota archaeon]
MSTEKYNKIETQKLALKMLGVTIIPIFLLVMITVIFYFVSFFLFYENITLLNQKYYGTVTLALLLPCFFSLAAAIIFVSPILFTGHKNNNSSNTIDYLAILQTMRKPTSRKPKIRRTFFWLFVSLAILSLIGSQIFLFVGVFVLL